MNSPLFKAAEPLSTAALFFTIIILLMKMAA